MKLSKQEMSSLAEIKQSFTQKKIFVLENEKSWWKGQLLIAKMHRLVVYSVLWYIESQLGFFEMQFDKMVI